MVDMIVKLNPQLPLVWRTPFSVQLGVDPAVVVIENITETQERLLAALVVGVTEPGLVMIAHGKAAEREDLLDALEPALLAPAAPSPVASIALSGVGPAAQLLERALSGSGVHVDTAADAADLADSCPDLAIVVAHHVVPPALHSLWLRRDVAHLPIVFSETGVTIGPVIEPGAGPCLLCLELHRRDADLAWPAIATQLLGRRSSAENPLLAVEAAAAACRIALTWLGGAARLGGVAGDAVSVRIEGASGVLSHARWEAHPECGCRGILPPLAAATGLADATGLAGAIGLAGAGPRESGWAAAARAPA